MSGPSSQEFESFLPVYDTVPEKWEEARQFLIEQLKKISTAVNTREIGWLLDQELLSGKSLFRNTAVTGTNEQFRSIFRKVIDFGALTIGVNTKAHGILVDSNFTLVQLYAAATNSTGLIGEPIPNGSDTISYDVTNIIITVAAAYDRCIAVIEYTQEL